MNRRDTKIYRRGRQLKPGKSGNGPVVYWMSRDLRVSDNWSLLWAQQEAIIYEKSLLVVFCLTQDLPDTTPDQINFMAQGLQPIINELHKLDIGWICPDKLPNKILPKLLGEIDAHSLICDFNPLESQKIIKKQLVEQLSIPINEVDSHNIIPAWTTSSKKEYAAYTIRPKIKRLLDDFLTDIPPLSHHPYPCTAPLSSAHEMWSVPESKNLTTSSILAIPSGFDKALDAAELFITNGLQTYGTRRNDPCQDGQSGLSPYLHFGQLSAQRLARMVLATNSTEEVTEPFLEELIVRRELSDNYCHYEENYDSIEGFSDWAQKTLNQHRDDAREYTYSLETLEKGKTHELLWNCCQLDLVHTGKLHGFLRMYWAKKILEWTMSPETALKYAITLNDKYSLDGHDPNGYTGVAWSIGGVHDRAWGERPVFGKIRYMNKAGCRRKFDVDSYTAHVLGTVDSK
ncbi:MAG: deoxyribodipyrimidine photo-lyase [Desulforhopalus sp.]|jgi:deoxyribodipyrimidine photo-lyase